MFANPVFAHCLLISECPLFLTSYRSLDFPVTLWGLTKGRTGKLGRACGCFFHQEWWYYDFHSACSLACWLIANWLQEFPPHPCSRSESFKNHCCNEQGSPLSWLYYITLDWLIFNSQQRILSLQWVKRERERSDSGSCHNVFVLCLLSIFLFCWMAVADAFLF